MRKITGHHDTDALVERFVPREFADRMARHAVEIAERERERIAAGRETISYAEWVARRRAARSS